MHKVNRKYPNIQPELIEANAGRDQKTGDRDVFNERPTREEQSTAVQPVEKVRASATVATIHTNKGDIVSRSEIEARSYC